MLAGLGLNGSYRKDGVEIFTLGGAESCAEIPLILSSGAVLSWNGRLDNRVDCIAFAGDGVSEASSDAAVVGACYARWGTEFLGKLLGDWALSVWSPAERSLVLARDAMGMWPLYYSAKTNRILWSTILDPLALEAGNTALEREYLAGWLGKFPAAHLTPYRGVYAVPPSCHVRFANGRITSTRFWDFNPGKTIHYKTDADYEHHLLDVFRESVRRRLRSSMPVLAELSGGMDSSAIVSMGDVVLSEGNCETSRLDTVSYYDALEPNWNEQPYFESVERKRGRVGCHINVQSQVFFAGELRAKRFRPTPSEHGIAPSANEQLRELLLANGYRVVLSGLGGDEVAGGVPSPSPELRDLIAAGRFRTLAGKLKQWALVQRRPWILLLREALSGFLPASGANHSRDMDQPSWLAPDFVREYGEALAGYPRRIRLFAVRPPFDEAMMTVDALRRQIAALAPPRDPVYERRYPFLDRDLLEFLFAIPREQLVRPGERRSLMRRAFRGIVPDEILDRKRKGFRARSSLAALTSERETLEDLTTGMRLDSLGIVRESEFRAALETARRGGELSAQCLRALAVEIWLRDAGVPSEQMPYLAALTGASNLKQF
jgi:asparagine synthase (glutamine-hydrolysing)